MDTQNNKLLEQCMFPVLLVAGGIVTQVNQAAAARQFAVGAKIDDLIYTGKDEYAVFTEGNLCLSLKTNDVVYPAIVTKDADFDIFQLDWEYQDPTLRAFALAAKQLRQPLSNAMLSADALGDHENAKQLNRSLYQLHRAICNMSDAAIYSACRQGRMENADVVAFIAEIMEKATNTLDKAGISVRYTAPKSGALGLIDSEKLERALLNLLSNAAKFTDKEKTIAVTLTHKGNKFYLSVETKGAAIANQVQNSLFSRYLREPELEDGRFGIGLGLTMVRNAAIAHNGTLLLENTTGGQRFTMSISPEHAKENTLRSPVLLPVDYTGGFDRMLVELSDVLPTDLY